jgi:hypothetical protein
MPFVALTLCLLLASTSINVIILPAPDIEVSIFGITGILASTSALV